MFHTLSENITQSPPNFIENTLNHCKSPFEPPIKSHETDTTCSASHDSCLSCQNLVITPLDIKKYFCYMNYYKYVYENGDISLKEYEKSTANKKHIWKTQILTKYPKLLVNKIRIDALKDPISEWDTSKYEQSK
jgi:hypothetical protein